MSTVITAERPDSPDAVALITELEATLEPLYPRESRHGLSVERLIAEAVPFFVLRAEGEAAGCGGVKLFGTAYGEIKRMYVRPRFRGMGFARLILNHLSDYAQAQGVNLLRLETGIYQREAIGLYERMGFHRIPPFGDYKEDPLSLLYEKALPVIEIVFAQTGKALEHAIALSQEYVGWMVAEIRERYPELDLREFTSEHDYDDIRKKFPGEHVPPDGCLLVALSDGEACGCVALGRLTETICELRTLYVRPAGRRAGVGKKLVEAALNEARKLGYRSVRLDTLAFMDSALKLYRSLGFYDIPSYRDVSASLKQRICFLELKLPIQG